ncbi:MAG TPA: hypothetical protein PLK12_12000 [Prolixibacteraceae bacterium]|nr:hypothetical protein [Prolixibacteraceae bacterium]
MRIKMILSLAFVLCLYHPDLFSQGLFETASKPSFSDGNPSFSMNGYVRGSAYGAGEVYDYTHLFGEISLKAGFKSGLFRFQSDLRVRSGHEYEEARTETEIKEAWAGVSTPSFDLFFGEQIADWGRTDGFNPTNNIRPTNYFFLSGNPDDQKMPNLMLRTVWRISSQIDWEIIAIPVFRPSVYRYDLLQIGDDVRFIHSVLPERSFENGSLASRLNMEFSRIGFSLSWFNGYDPFYGFRIAGINWDTGKPIITYQPDFYRKNSFGLDFALPIGPVIWRGEGVYNQTEASDEDIHIPRSHFSYVSGLEWMAGNFTLLAQYVGNFTPGFHELTEPIYPDPISFEGLSKYANDQIMYQSARYNRAIFRQQEKFHHALSAAVNATLLRETLTLECAAYYDFTTEEYLVRPRVELKIGNGLSVMAGYSLMQGPDSTLFHYASPLMNGAFLEFKATF